MGDSGVSDETSGRFCLSNTPQLELSSPASTPILCAILVLRNDLPCLQALRCELSSRATTESLSKPGARTPGWEGTMAKPVKTKCRSPALTRNCDPE